MEVYRFLLILCSFLDLAILRSHALEVEKSHLSSYWHSALPNTKMPKSVLNSLQPDGTQNYNKIINVKTILEGSALPTSGKDSYAAADSSPDASEKLQIEPGVTIFFLQKDLHPGKKMKLHFPKTTNRAKFLPRKVSESIPFSTAKMSEILNRFKLQPKSAEAEALRETIEECEQASIEGEDKYCATSLESMVEFSVSKLGKKDIDVVSTEVDEGGKRVYKIVENGVKKIAERSVTCHKENYAYAVFYCHEIKATTAYTVSMVGINDGTKAKAVAVCHTDTRTWNRNHLAFQLLKIKPGTDPVCHFLPSDSLVWVPN